MADLNVPLDKGHPVVYLEFDIDPGVDYGKLATSLDMVGMMNSGYVIKATMTDAEHQMFTRFIESGYFQKSRVKPITIFFSFKSGPIDAEPPQYGTKVQKAIITHTEYFTDKDDRVTIKFIAIDPASFYLSMGDASGASYKGRLDQVVTQVVHKYASKLNFSMSPTKDSELNRYWMMRQDPKTFIVNLLEWSPPLNDTKTNWVAQVDGYDFKINDQGSIGSRTRGFYTRYAGATFDSIAAADVVANNALNLVSTKLFTAGAGSNTGDYLDRITDSPEAYTVSKDTTTPNKKIPAVLSDHSYNKPDDSPSSGPPHIGGTFITSIPEYISDDIGLDYKDYIDGRGRTMYMQLLHSVLKVRLTVKGHGEFSDTMGLGVDTVYVDWNRSENNEDSDEEYWMHGYWTIYGFKHRLIAGNWWTDLFISRPDQNAIGKRVSPAILN